MIMRMLCGKLCRTMVVIFIAEVVTEAAKQKTGQLYEWTGHSDAKSAPPLFAIGLLLSGLFRTISSQYMKL